VIAAFVPEVGKAKEGEVREIEAAKKSGKSIQRGMSPGAELPGFAPLNFSGVRTLLVDGAVGRGNLFQRDLAEGLFVLGEVVAEDIPQSFRLLRAEVDALKVLDVQLFGSVLG